jgi:hypothetical protein
MTKKPKTSTTGSMDSMIQQLMVSIECHAEAYALPRVQDCCHKHELLPKRAKATTKSTKRDNIQRHWVDKSLLHIPESSTSERQNRRCLTDMPSGTYEDYQTTGKASRSKLIGWNARFVAIQPSALDGSVIWKWTCQSSVHQLWRIGQTGSRTLTQTCIPFSLSSELRKYISTYIELILLRTSKKMQEQKGAAVLKQSINPHISG